MPETHEQAIDRNYTWFLTQLSALLPAHEGRYALIHNQSLIALFDTPGDAQREGERQFPGGFYSIQPVEQEVVDMGYFSYARH
jgi:murein L,D-transpeptidase YafK